VKEKVTAGGKLSVNLLRRCIIKSRRGLLFEVERACLRFFDAISDLAKSAKALLQVGGLLIQGAQLSGKFMELAIEGKMLLLVGPGL
jgi:hypothetical protein